MNFTFDSNAFAQSSYLYEANRDLRTRVRNQRLDGTAWEDVSRYDYRYDDLGRRTDVVNTGPVFSDDALSLWNYNDRSEVIAQNRHLGTDPQNPGTGIPTEDFSYAYDPIGNRVSSKTGTDPQRGYTSNELNQYIELGASAPLREPVHDKDGNLIETGDGWYYEWNAENRLIEARDYDTAASSGSQRLSFVYDYMGRRVAKMVETYNGSGWVTDDERRFVYQDWNLILEIDGSQDILKGYLWGMDLSGTAQGAGGVGGLLAMVDAQENLAAAAFYDANGNLTQLYDWMNEEVIAHYEYGPFGDIINQTGTYADANTFRFSTKYLDVETDLYYYGFRYMDPETGRWPNRDPIGERGGLNLYVMVWNDPLNWIDYLGLAKIGSRPLGPGYNPLMTRASGSIADRGNFEISHRHIFFEDGKDVWGEPVPSHMANIGYGPGREGEEGSQFFPEDERDFNYKFDPIRYDDDMMRQAAQNVMKSGKFSRRDEDCEHAYRLMGNNCQDFCDAVLDEYDRLLDDWKKNNPEEYLRRYSPPPEIPEIRPATPIPYRILR